MIIGQCVCVLVSVCRVDLLFDMIMLRSVVLVVVSDWWCHSIIFLRHSVAHCVVLIASLVARVDVGSFSAPRPGEWSRTV